jgi:hypothetical protein
MGRGVAALIIALVFSRRGRNAEALENVRTITDDPRMRLVEGCLEKRPSSEIAELSNGAHGFSLSDKQIRGVPESATVI